MRITFYMLTLALAIGLLAWKVCFSPRLIPTAQPALEQGWNDQVSELDQDEVLRFVAPSNNAIRKFQFSTDLNDDEVTHCVLSVDARSGTWHKLQSTGENSIRDAILCCSGLSELGFEMSQLPMLPSAGDWYMSEDVPIERRMQALQSLLSVLAGRELIIEKKLADREVIIAQGTWAFQDFKDDSELGFYISSKNTTFPGPGWFMSGTLEESFKELETVLHRIIVDEVSDPRPRQLDWKSRRTWDRASDEANLDSRLGRIEKETSLKFIRTHRQIPIWFLREKPPTTQPASIK